MKDSYLKKSFTLLLSVILFFINAPAQTDTATFAQIYQRKMPAWFNEAKFGVFIVWGIYSVPGWAPKGGYAEWYGNAGKDPNSPNNRYHEKVWGKDFTYDKFVPLLNGEGFSADAWMDLIQKSGAKYVVTAANYHDGFAMYPTQYSVSKFGDHWNAFDRGPKRDVLGEIFKAGNSRGLTMGMYYSLYEWWHPLYMKGEVEKYTREHLHPKFKEVVSNYHPKVIFLDGEWEHSYKTWHSEELANWLYTQSPVKNEVVVNDRWGYTRSQYGDYFSSEYGGGDYSPAHPWQEDRGIGKSYGYNRNEDVWDYNSRGELLQLLSKVCSNGGNLLLDIGPTADGRIPPIMQERLLQIGEWLKPNAASIYGSTASPFWPRKFEWGVCTYQPGIIYLHVFDPSLTQVNLQGISNEITSVKYLATGQKLSFTKNKEDLKISLPSPMPDKDVSVIAVSIKGEPVVDKRPHQYESNQVVIPAWSMQIHGSKAKMYFDGFEKIAHISNWTNTKDSLSCLFVVNKTGRYKMSITYCSDSASAGSELVMAVNNQSLHFTSSNTDGWNGSHYQEKECGIVSVDKPGEQRLSLVPVATAWKNMAVKAVTLNPL
jgi:alpha-L-fucosidase